MLFHTFGCSYFVFSAFQWQFAVQRFGFKWSLLFYTGRFILGQQPCAELAVQEDTKKKNDFYMTVMSELKLLVMMLMLPKFIFKVNIFCDHMQWN